MMEVERLKEETKAEEKDLVTAHPHLLSGEPYTWLMMITDGENGREQHIFYSITEDHYYVRFVQELQNKHVACCYGGWLVLRDNSTNDCSILNILTMEKLQLPPLSISYNKLCIECVLSSSKMDKSCRAIFINSFSCKFWSCHLGDSEFIEQELIDGDGCGITGDLIHFKGKIYAMTNSYNDLIAFDFSDPNFHHEEVISGESIPDFIHYIGFHVKFYLVKSCEDLLLICIGSYHYDNFFEISNVKILRADLSVGEWVIVETLGDRAIFLGSRNNNFSSPATDLGMKGNVVYWVRTPFRHLHMWDIEDKSISVSLPFPAVLTHSSLSWVSFPMTCNEEKKPKQTDLNPLFEASPIETNFHVQRGKATIESTELQIQQTKTKKREQKEAIVRKGCLWADLPSDLLLMIFPHLFAGDKVAFRSVCTSWYSVSPSRTTQQSVLPLQRSDCPFPFLMCPDNKVYNPIHGELYSINFPDIPGAKIRAARDGWLLLDYNSSGLRFYNPFTKEDISLPDFDAIFYYSVYFSAPPTSADCLVVVAAKMEDNTYAICFKKFEDEGWTCREISLTTKECFRFFFCNGVVYKDLYYFLGQEYGYDSAKLLIFNPMKDEVRVIETPKPISEHKTKGGQQYLLESDGKLIAVFVGTDGSYVYTCEWNVCTSKWEVLGSLGNNMLFVSRPLSLCKRATVSGTGNKIYFPRIVGDAHILFYSLATRRYHTFEMGTSYPNLLASKYYTEYNGWFMS